MARRLPAWAPAAAAWLLLVSLSATGAEPSTAPPADGPRLYAQFCAGCHDHPTARIPARATLARRSPDEVLQALDNGAMRAQAAGLNANDRLALATFLTGHAPSSTGGALAPEGHRCRRQGPARATGPEWNGWGRDLANTRFQPHPGLTAADVAHLELRWAYGYHGPYVYGQPTVVGGRLYVTSSAGRVYSLDARTGCTEWTFDAQAPARTAMSVVPVGARRLAAIFGDDSATVYALDATSGALIWKRRLDPHPAARITGAPVFHAGRLYVPVASLEELSAPAPGYECCTFRGSVAALDAADGKLLWQTYTIAAAPRPYRRSARGTQLYGPAGGSVWSAPTLDPQHDLLYVGTGNSYTDVPTAHTDSILALQMSSGRIRWANQLHPQDNYIVGCDTASSAGQGNCPEHLGPDVDFGVSPILQTLPGGRRVLLTGEKSGQVYGLDPASGKLLWTRRVSRGSSLGGIEWGAAADEHRMYVAVSDIVAAGGKPGGLFALKIGDGAVLWHATPPPAVCSWGPRNCSAAQSQAVTAIPGVVFSGSEDGHLRAYASADGRILWDFDTGRSFVTVNGVAAAGGSLDHGGPTVAGGMLYVNSGYGRIHGQPGNVLLAFGVARPSHAPAKP